MIELRHIRKVFNAGQPNEHVAVDDVNLAIGTGKVTVLRGPSGSGKTTLLTVLGCMARPTSGRILLQDREVTSLPARFLTAIRRKTFGFIFQQYNLIQGISVIENVMLPAYPNGDSLPALKQRAEKLLDLFNLRPKASARVEWLSGGEAQRTAIARALVNDPQVIIADEPTAHLDTKLSRELMEIVKEFKAQGKTIVIASHDPIVHDSPVIDKVVDMRDGRLIHSGAA
ncbi:MAG: ABC transporter ATP-binding protein [Deltaproteobacteria bacterium]|nr:MAG: ABC transporter ATP-binding protein [Deltaproteobacteria bacterium]